MEYKAFQPIFSKITRINKATCELRSTRAGYEELAIVHGRMAQVVKIMGDKVTLQVFAGTDGIPTNAEVIFTGRPPVLKVSKELCGRFFYSYCGAIYNG